MRERYEPERDNVGDQRGGEVEREKESIDHETDGQPLQAHLKDVIRTRREMPTRPVPFDDQLDEIVIEIRLAPVVGLKNGFDQITRVPRTRFHQTHGRLIVGCRRRLGQRVRTTGRGERLLNQEGSRRRRVGRCRRRMSRRSVSSVEQHLLQEQILDQIFVVHVQFVLRRRHRQWIGLEREAVRRR